MIGEKKLNLKDLSKTKNMGFEERIGRDSGFCVGGVVICGRGVPLNWCEVLPCSAHVGRTLCLL